MEPLLPSEVARLVFGYLKKEKNEDAAECFLKSSPHLTECYKMFKSNKNFNLKVNGFNLNDIFDIFGTMCSMINERISEACESKTLIEQLQYLLDANHKPTKEDKCVETELNVVDKCISCIITTENKSTLTNEETNNSITKVLENPSFTEIISSDMSKTNKNTINNEIININIKDSKKIEENIVNQPEYQQIPEATSLESMPGLSKGDTKEIKDNSVVIDTGELVDTFLNDQSLLEKIADNINKSIETQREADDNIQNCNTLDPPTLEKALDSTQSDPQIKNILDEFLVFNVDNSDDGKKKCNQQNQQSTIKSRLRSAKKKDDAPNKSKKSNSYTPKHNTNDNNDCKKSDDSNIVLVHEGNIKTLFESCDLLSNQILLQSNNSNVGQSFNFETKEMESEEDYNGRANYVKIAPKMTPMLKAHQVSEKHIFPRRTRRSLEQFGIRSKFKRTNITSMQPTGILQSPQSIVIEVPSQSSIENQTKSNLDVNIIKLPDMNKKSSHVKDIITHDTPDDRQIPPKNKSLSTPRRRSTHIRCLDFSTPQPKNIDRDNARSKLFCDSPKICEKIVEESISSPLPKLQADWGSVNGFESIVKKEKTKHWDTDIREMVGAGVLTSDSDGRKTKKKKTPRKKIKPVNDKNNSEIMIEKQNKTNNSSGQSNESNNIETFKSNTPENQLNLDEENCNKPLLNEQKSLKKPNEIPILLKSSDKIVTELFNEQPSNKSDSLTNIDQVKSLKTQSKFPHSLETPNEIVSELFDEKSLNKSDSLKHIDSLKSLNNQSKFPISLETPDKVTELLNEQPSNNDNGSIKSFIDPTLLKPQTELVFSLETPNKIMEMCDEKSSNKSDSLKNFDNSKASESPREFPISLETPCKTTEICNEQQSITNDYSKSPCNIQNNLNQLNTIEKEATISCISKTVPETENMNKKTESNFLETFNNHNLSKENLDSQTSLNIKTNNSNQVNSPIKLNNIQPVKQKIFETPYKCDDSAVDVPETPISKLIREYDPSKLMTPLPSTPVHFDDSLSETPLTKVFRETSYLNRPPISPFPPTPGNSRSVDTLIQPEQGNSNTIIEYLEKPNQSNINIENPTNVKKVKTLPLKTKTKLSTKTKIKNGLKGKSVEAKKKQVYESVKVELFGSEITSSSSADELEKTKNQHKTIVINKKNQGAEKKSGFKPIPKRKSMQAPTSLVNGFENPSLNEINTILNNSMKPAIEQKNNSTLHKIDKISNIKQLNKSKKSMVHFDDPVEQYINQSTKLNTSITSSTAVSKIKNKIVDDNCEPLVGLSRYLNQPSSFYECNSTKKSGSAEKIAKISKLNNSDSNINYSEFHNEIKSSENLSITSQTSFMDKTKTHQISEQKIKSFENCSMFGNEKENNKSYSPIDSIQSSSIYTKTANQDCNSKNKTNNTSIQNSNSSVNNNMINTSCITVGHNNELKKVYNSVDNIEYLKTPKVYEVISDDGEHQLVNLQLTEPFSLLDIPSELNNEQPSNPNCSSFITTKELDVTPEIEPGELKKDDSPIPVTSTPKDAIVKSEERKNRFRRSPSFWEDSIHNYPVNHRDDRYRESNSWQSKSNRDRRYDKKYRQNSRHHDDRSQFTTFNRYSQRSHHMNIKNEFRDDGVRDKDRFKHKDDKRRSYRDDRKGRDRLDESERFSITQRISQNESQKLSRADDIVKKATKRPANRTDHNEIPPKTSKVEHQRLLKNVNVDDFLSVVHGQK
ncbi:uncharacterized protein LOC112684318 [Sipha flava]|uniref:Uncharacterized protein LOC112684318 n=1 Tax=Sipha flava TaxID=143950 RepID=A0A8B8FM38_9HEMI|nr:uncharacterized protein LOC112684318 [Sipha flava]